MQIRDATWADVEALETIYRDASLSNAGDREVLLANPQHLVWDRSLLEDAHVRVAVLHETVAGFATTSCVDGSCELVDLFVDPVSMRKGIGRKLVDDARDLASTAGCEALYVTANPHSHAFYDAVGLIAGQEVATELGTGLRMHSPVEFT